MVTVFVLEDDPDLLNLYTRALRHKGYDVTFSSSAERAINMLHEGEYVVIPGAFSQGLRFFPGPALPQDTATPSL